MEDALLGSSLEVTLQTDLAGDAAPIVFFLVDLGGVRGVLGVFGFGLGRIVDIIFLATPFFSFLGCSAGLVAFRLLLDRNEIGFFGVFFLPTSPTGLSSATFLTGFRAGGVFVVRGVGFGLGVAFFFGAFRQVYSTRIRRYHCVERFGFCCNKITSK